MVERSGLDLRERLVRRTSSVLFQTFTDLFRHCVSGGWDEMQGDETNPTIDLYCFGTRTIEENLSMSPLC